MGELAFEPIVDTVKAEPQEINSSLMTLMTKQEADEFLRYHERTKIYLVLPEEKHKPLFDESKYTQKRNDDLNPDDLVNQVSFALSLPVLISAAGDLMLKNKNFALTRTTLNLYKNTTVGVCKFTGKSINNTWKNQIKPRAKNAWDGWNKPLKDNIPKH